MSAEARTSAEETPKSPPSVEDDVAEFAGLLGMTVHDLKSVAVREEQDDSDPSDGIRKAFECSGLGRRHVRALLAVTASEPVSVTELAARLGLLLSTTSAIVGELSRAGLLERQEDERDRRRTLVRVHEDYRDVMAMRLRVAFAPVRRTFEQLSARERAAFMDTFRLLNQEAAQAADDPDA